MRPVATQTIEMNRAKNSNDEPEVLLEDHDDERRAPCGEQRSEVLRVGQVDRSDAADEFGQQFALLDEVAGEEDRENDLGQLAGLEARGPEAHPDARPVDVAAEHWHEGQQQEADTDHREGVSVTLEVARSADDDQRRDERGNADHRPHGLEPGEVLVQPGDEHVADAVEKPGDREQHAVGVWGQPPSGDMGRGQQAENDREEWHDVGRQRCCLAETGEGVAAHGHQCGQNDEAEFGAPPAGGARDRHQGVVVVAPVTGGVAIIRVCWWSRP